MTKPRYRFGRILRRGGMAEIVEAQMFVDGSPPLDVVIKWPRSELVGDAGLLRAFLDEARILGSLVHPNLVEVLDSGMVDGRPFLTLERIDGIDLGELCEHAPLSADLILFIGAELARALDFVHNAKDEHGVSREIVHRDVSHENVMISAAGAVKLLDFGIARARLRWERTQTGMVKGRMEYMAPEQASGGPATPRTDIFSIGRVLERAAKGTIDVDLETIVERCTRNEPTERYTSAADLLTAIEAALSRRRFAHGPEALSNLVRAARNRKRKAPVDDLFDIDRVLAARPDDSRVTETLRQSEPTSLPAPTPIHEMLLDDWIGREIRGCTIEALIGDGPVTRVYLAAHSILRRKVAIKILTAPSADAESRLLREARALSELDHPNLVKVYDAGTTEDGFPFAIVEQVNGRTVHELVESEGPLPPIRALAIARQIAFGLSAVHACGFVHRDLRPGTVMISREGSTDRVRLLDFGWVRAFDSTRLTTIDEVVGDPSYVAPEQLSSASAVDASADLYALGGIIQFMLTGAAPGTASARSNSGLESVIDSLRQKAPRRRPSSASVVLRALDAAAAGPRGLNPAWLFGIGGIGASLLALGIFASTRTTASTIIVREQPSIEPPAAPVAVSVATKTATSATPTQIASPSTRVVRPKIARSIEPRKRSEPPPEPPAAKALEPADITPSALDQRLRRIATRLRAGSAELDPAVTAELDRRYLDLRASVPPYATPEQCAKVARRIDDFEREIDRLLSSN